MPQKEAGVPDSPLKWKPLSKVKDTAHCYSITVVGLFSPSLHPTPAEPTSLPHPPPWLCPCVLYSSSCNPLSSLSPPYSPLAIVRLLLTEISFSFTLWFTQTMITYSPTAYMIFILYLNKYLLNLKKKRHSSRLKNGLFHMGRHRPLSAWHRFLLALKSLSR